MLHAIKEVPQCIVSVEGSIYSNKVQGKYGIFIMMKIWDYAIVCSPDGTVGSNRFLYKKMFILPFSPIWIMKTAFIYYIRMVREISSTAELRMAVSKHSLY